MLDRLQTPKMFKQTPRRTCPYARNLQKFRRAVAHLPAFAMKGYGKTVSLVSNELNEMQHRRVVIESNGIFLLSVDV